MCRPLALSAWMAELEAAFAHLSKPQVKVLAQYSLGMTLSGRCGLSSVAFALAQWLGQKFDAVRERLRDWYCNAADKSGGSNTNSNSNRSKRRELDVESCFAPLLGWVLRDWEGQDLAIALDATTLGQRFVVLAISVLYQACAIPVAWTILPATAKGAWKPRWLELLARFEQRVPPHLRVIALADRGLYARWLFRAIVALGWHPFLRVNTHNAEFKPHVAAAAHAGRPPSPPQYVPLESLLEGVGSTYQARGTMFRSADARQTCTLAACWASGYAEGWFVVSDLPPEQVTAAWYGLRSWIERGFKHAKSGGWNWQETRMTDPDRASRQWLAMAVATVLLVRQGSAAATTTATTMTTEATETKSNDRESVENEAPSEHQARSQALLTSEPTPEPTPEVEATPEPTVESTSNSPSKGRRRRRILSAFRKGLMIVQAALLANQPLPPTPLVPEPWPMSMPDHPP